MIPTRCVTGLTMERPLTTTVVADVEPSSFFWLLPEMTSASSGPATRTQRRSTMKPMSAAIASAAITTPATMSPALPRRTSMYSPCHRTCALQVWSHAIERPFPVGRSNRRHRGWLQQFLCNRSLSLLYTVQVRLSKAGRRNQSTRKTSSEILYTIMASCS